MIDYKYKFPEHENNKDIFGEQNNYNVFIDASGFTYLGTYEKDKRKYIGIVFQINGINYFAPLSSYKTKHVKMRESVDFIKIKDYAVINLNNMIPIPQSQIVEIDINKEKYDIFSKQMNNDSFDEIVNEIEKILVGSVLQGDHTYEKQTS